MFCTYPSWNWQAVQLLPRGTFSLHGQLIVLAILDDQAVIIHGDSVKGIERVIVIMRTQTRRQGDLTSTKMKPILVSTRISYVLGTSFSFWIRCTIATRM